MTADQNGTSFAIVRRGYDRAQVDERLSRLLADRDAATASGHDAVSERERISRELDVSRGETRAARTELADNRTEIDRLAGQVAELSTIPHTVDGMSDRLQQMVRVAQDEVNDMRSRATRGAAQILSMAQAEADELRESSHQERRSFETEQHGVQEELRVRLEETRAQLATMREEADGQRARLDAELADRRAHDDQTLAAEIAERREVMLADLASQERRQREEAQRIVDAASARARTLLEEAAGETDRARSHAREQVVRATEELDQLRALQQQVAEQLAGVRSLLDWTLPRINTTTGAPQAETTVPGVAPASVPAQRTAPADTGFGGQTRDDHRLQSREREVSLFERSHFDTPLFGATAAAVDDTRSATGRGHTDDGADDDQAVHDPADHDRAGYERADHDQVADHRDVEDREGDDRTDHDQVTDHRDVDDRDGDDRAEPEAEVAPAAEPEATETAATAETASTSTRGSRLPHLRGGGDRAEATRPSPVARGGHRAAARH